MAFVKKQTQQLPEDAIIISQEEAYNFQLEIIGRYKTSETWALKYGFGILGALGGISGIYINNHFRNKLKLRNYGKLSTYLPIVALPAALATVNHKIFIERPIILQSEKCPVCTLVRSATIQCGLSTIYPALLAPFASLMFATRHYTYRLPSITTEPKEVFKLILKFSKPIGGFITGSILFNMIAAMWITYNEMEQYFAIQKHLQKIAEKYDNNLLSKS